MAVARQEQDLTQHALAALVGTSQSSISLLETGLLRPHRGLADRLGQALKLAPEDLLLEYELYVRRLEG